MSLDASGDRCLPPPPSAEDLRRARARVASLAAVLARYGAHAATLRASPSLLSEALARVYEAHASRASRDLAVARRELAALARRQRCGARCRDGHPCGAPRSGRGGRCKLHGGRSTGPRTAEGKARALAALAQVNASKAHPATPAS